MALLRATHRDQPLEDWIDELSRVVLVVLLLATLFCVL
jgi:hypothetical protein